MNIWNAALICFAGPIAMTIAGLLIWGAASIGLIP